MRRGQVGTVAILTMVADTLALGVALVFLGFGAGALSLVIQRLSREGILTAGFGLSRRWQMRFAFDFQEAKEHAQKLAREKYYLEYSVQVCTLDRESKFEAAPQTTVAQR